MSMTWDIWWRFLSIFAGMTVMLCVGSGHAVSAWNGQLRSLLNFSQAEISLVFSMGSFGSYFSATPGYVFDHIGPYNSLLLGALLLSGLYFTLSLCIEKDASILSPFIIGICFVIIGQASNFGVFASLGPNEGLFGERHRGKIMALQLAAFSGGGALFVFLYHHVFDHNVPGYFKFLSFSYLFVFLFGWVVLYPKKDPSTSEVTTNLQDASPKAGQLHFQPSDTVDVTGRKLLADMRFWLLYCSVFILVGAALFVMNNVSFIVESAQGPMDQVPSMVALFSIGNCLGRICAGAASDHLIERIPRVNFIGLAAIVTSITHLLFLLIPSQYLVIPITLSGIADGIMFASFPVLTRETFGSKHFGKNFGLINIANAMGFPLFYGPLSSLFYANESQTIDDVQKCIGPHCFRPIFLLIFVLSFVVLICCRKFATLQIYHRIP